MRLRLLAPLFATSLLACAHSATVIIPATPREKHQGTLAVACPALPSGAELSSERVLERFGSALERYQLEGGEWLPHAPVLVNEDFDFSLLALGDFGPGIAASKRKKANEEKASALADVQLSREVWRALDALRARASHAFFVLWGSDSAVLRLVVDEDLTCEPQGKTRIIEGPSVPLSDWRAPQALDAAARKLLGVP